MSLKDLKSNLGDYRRPKSEPLEVKTRVEPSAFNTVPLTDKIKTKNDVQYSRQTPEKVGTSQNKVSQGDKFKGQTDTNEVTQGDKFKGQTDTNEVTQGDKFKGETNPTLANQTEKFKGETNPTLANQTEKFKGETNPTLANQSEKFKGETNPKDFKFVQNFLGETTPNESDRGSKFLGETTPNESDRSSKFLGETTPNESDRGSKFLGETTPNESDKSSKFLGETTPTESDKSSKFLGETTPPVAGQGDKFKGETTPNDFSFNGNLENQGLEVGQKVNFFTDDKAVGFSPFMSTVDDTKFTGIDGTQFDNATSLLSNFGSANRGISFQAGYGQYKVGQPTGDSQRYSPDGDRYIDSYISIGDALQQRQSPSFLDEMYNKFNLQDPEANKFSLIPQPYVLRGIQRKKITKGEPQSWGFGFPIDDGLIRGGIVSSTERAAFDLVRMGSFFLSVKGLLWSATQIGMQRSNTHNKVWTPANFLASIGGQHIGFKPDRGGILGLDILGKYQLLGSPTEGKLQAPALKQLYTKFGTINIGSDLKEIQGGTDSVYGIGKTFVKRYTDSFIIGKGVISTGNKITGLSDYTQKFFFNDLDKETEETYFKSIPTDPDELKKYGVITQLEKLQKFNEDNKPNLTKSVGVLDDKFDIRDYQMISQGLLSDLADEREQVGSNPVKPSDFRKKLESGRGKDDAKDYDTENIETKFNFGNPGRIVDVNGDGRKGQLESDYTAAKIKAFKLHYDKVNATKIGETETDLVNLIFKLGTDASQLQFRGTVSGLAENFSPSYNEIKYSGRAEPVYVYDSFKRDISFSFKVYPTSRIEMQPLWAKLERLSTYTMPRYSGAGYTAPGNDASDSELQLTIGNLYVETPMILTSLSYTYSDDTAWDLDFGLPMGIDVQVGCTVLGNSLHEYDNEDIFAFDGTFRGEGFE